MAFSAARRGIRGWRRAALGQIRTLHDDMASKQHTGYLRLCRPVDTLDCAAGTGRRKVAGGPCAGWFRF
jgi:hypothetical protein